MIFNREAAPAGDAAVLTIAEGFRQDGGFHAAWKISGQAGEPAPRPS